MGIYERYILPRLVVLVLRGREVHKGRAKTLASARGRVLEVGFGNGLNLQHYTDAVEELVGIDPSDQTNKLAKEEMAKVAFPVSTRVGVAEELPFEDSTFDTVTMTYTLCTVPDPARGLAEIQRVLKPGGKFHFVEHGLSQDPRMARWQNRLNPVQRFIGGGCNLNRNHWELIQAAGMTLEIQENYHLKDGIAIAAYTYRGVAVMPA